MHANDNVRAWYKDLKENAACIICGFAHPAAIEFHHEDPKEKRYTLSFMVHNGFDLASVKKEFAKTVPLCKNCHAIEHWNEELNYRTQYGTKMKVAL